MFFTTPPTREVLLTFVSFEVGSVLRVKGFKPLLTPKTLNRYLTSMTVSQTKKLFGPSLDETNK